MYGKILGSRVWMSLGVTVLSNTMGSDCLWSSDFHFFHSSSRFVQAQISRVNLMISPIFLVALMSWLNSNRYIPNVIISVYVL